SGRSGAGWNLRRGHGGPARRHRRLGRMGGRRAEPGERRRGPGGHGGRTDHPSSGRGRLGDMPQRVMITGISRHLAGKLAQRLESDPDVEYIVGVDLEEPEVDLERTEYVRAD